LADFAEKMVCMWLSTVSGRSSAIGDVTVDSTTAGGQSDVGGTGGGGVTAGESSVGGGTAMLDSESTEADHDFNRHMHVLRLRILDRLVHYLPDLSDVGGVRAIPFMQVWLSIILRSCWLVCC